MQKGKTSEQWACPGTATDCRPGRHTRERTRSNAGGRKLTCPWPASKERTPWSPWRPSPCNDPVRFLMWECRGASAHMPESAVGHVVLSARVPDWQ